MNCEQLGELDCNFNLGKFFVRIHYTSTSFDILPLVDFYITFSFLGPKLISF